jgi:hypothetical protein
MLRQCVLEMVQNQQINHEEYEVHEEKQSGIG